MEEHRIVGALQKKRVDVVVFYKIVINSEDIRDTREAKTNYTKFRFDQ